MCFLRTVARQRRLSVRRSVRVRDRVWTQRRLGPAVPAMCSHELGPRRLGRQVHRESGARWRGSPRRVGRRRRRGPAGNWSRTALRRATEKRRLRRWRAFCLHVTSRCQQRCHLSRQGNVKRVAHDLSYLNFTRQQGYAGSKTLLQQNPAVWANAGCPIYNGVKQ